MPTNDPLDIGYVAIGALGVWQAHGAGAFQGGQLDFIDACLQTMPSFTDAWMRTQVQGCFPGAWAYEVAAPYGRIVAMDLHDGREIAPAQAQAYLQAIISSVLEAYDTPLSP